MSSFMFVCKWVLQWVVRAKRVEFHLINTYARLLASSSQNLLGLLAFANYDYPAIDHVELLYEMFNSLSLHLDKNLKKIQKKVQKIYVKTWNLQLYFCTIITYQVLAGLDHHWLCAGNSWHFCGHFKIFPWKNTRYVPRGFGMFSCQVSPFL